MIYSTHAKMNESHTTADPETITINVVGNRSLDNDAENRGLDDSETRTTMDDLGLAGDAENRGLDDPETRPTMDDLGLAGDPETRPTMDDLGLAWYLHCYGFAALFLILALVSSSLVCFMLCTRHKRKYTAFKYYAMLTCCIGLLGLSRALALFIDPYGLMMVTHKVMAMINLNLANAFLASAIYMLLIVLVRLTQMKITSNRFLGLGKLIAIIIINVTVSVVADVLAAFTHRVDIVMVICSCYFILWDTGCCIAFVYILVKFHRLIYVNRKRLQNQNYENSSTSTSQETNLSSNSETTVCPSAKPKPRQPKMPVAMKISLVIFVLFVVHIGSLVYVVLMLTALKDSPRHRTPWAQWTSETINRLVELAFGSAILAVCLIAVRSAR